MKYAFFVIALLLASSIQANKFDKVTDANEALQKAINGGEHAATWFARSVTLTPTKFDDENDDNKERFIEAQRGNLKLRQAIHTIRHNDFFDQTLYVLEILKKSGFFAAIDLDIDKEDLHIQFTDFYNADNIEIPIKLKGLSYTTRHYALMHQARTKSQF